jgi:hypothetical protein
MSSKSDTYLVLVGGCPVGTRTALGTVVEVDRVSIDYTLVTFDTGEVKRYRYNQALPVLAED